MLRNERTIDVLVEWPASFFFFNIIDDGQLKANDAK